VGYLRIVKESRWIAALDILQKASAAGDIHELTTPTDAQHGYSCFPSSIAELDLPFVAHGIEGTNTHKRFLAEKPRCDIASTRKH